MEAILARAAKMRNDDPQFTLKAQGMSADQRAEVYRKDIAQLLKDVAAVVATIKNPADLYQIRLELASMHGMQ
jgi:hypothetical protein